MTPRRSANRDFDELVDEQWRQDNRPPAQPAAKHAHLCGPIHGVADMRVGFESAREVLEQRGYRVTTPLTTAAEAANMTAEDIHSVPPGSAPWRQAVRLCLQEILDSDEIWLLPGWTRSRGACTEAFVAMVVGIPVFETWTGLEINPRFVLELVDREQL